MLPGVSLPRRWPFNLSVVGWLRLTWIVALLWYEFGSFYYSLYPCKWPDKSLQSSSQPTHVLLVTDPQVRYVPRLRHRWSDKWRHTLFHRTLRKNWSFAYGMNPDAVVFLGDMLAHGHHLDDEDEYDQYFEHFQQLLPVNDLAPVHYVPGNEDVGLRINVKAARGVRRRFEEHFGPLNQRFSISNHVFVILDAPGLVEEDYHRAEQGSDFANLTASPGGAIEFVQKMAEHEPVQPTILFTHIPLARPELASCGPLRERGTIRRGVGAGYQNTVGKRTTHFLLKDVHPSMVFSGDDRDYCDYTHRDSGDDPNSSGIREVTVKSFSPFQSISHPGFHLLSLVDPLSNPHAQSPSFADQACFLPDHHGVYTARYFPLLIITLVVLLISRYRSRRQPPSRLPLYYTDSPAELDEDTKCSPATNGAAKWHWSPQAPFSPDSPTTGKSFNEFFPSTLRAPLASADSKFRVNKAKTPTTPAFRASIHASFPLLPDFLASPLPPSGTFNVEKSCTEHIDLQERSPFPGDEDFEHDHMCTAPYTPRSTSSSTDSPTSGSQYDYHLDISSSTPSLWLSGTTSGFFTLSPPEFHRKQWWKWSWSFVLRGRRRRMTVSLPVIWRMHPWRTTTSSASSSQRQSSLPSYGEVDWAEKFSMKPKTAGSALWSRRGKQRSRWWVVISGSLVDFWHVTWPTVVMWLLISYWDQQ